MIFNATADQEYSTQYNMVYVRAALVANLCVILTQRLTYDSVVLLVKTESDNVAETLFCLGSTVGVHGFGAECQVRNNSDRWRAFSLFIRRSTGAQHHCKHHLFTIFAVKSIQCKRYIGTKLEHSKAVLTALRVGLYKKRQKTQQRQKKTNK